MKKASFSVCVVYSSVVDCGKQPLLGRWTLNMARFLFPSTTIYSLFFSFAFVPLSLVLEKQNLGFCLRIFNHTRSTLEMKTRSSARCFSENIMKSRTNIYVDGTRRPMQQYPNHFAIYKNRRLAKMTKK